MPERARRGGAGRPASRAAPPAAARRRARSPGRSTGSDRRRAAAGAAGAAADGIEVTDRWRPATPRAFAVRVADAARREGGRPELRVSLLLTGDAEIARLHGAHLGDPTPTDVMSFELDDDAVEVVVSVERARREARTRGHAVRAELALYVVHGILHACGHDDRAAATRRRMRQAEQRVLQTLGLAVAAFE